MKHTFILNVNMRLDEHFDAPRAKRVERLLDRAATVLKKYKPKRESDKLVFESDDCRLGLALLDRTSQIDEDCCVHEISRWDVPTLVRARYVRILAAGSNYVDEDASGMPLNEPESVLCSVCGWPGDKPPRQAYRVWSPYLRGKQEIFIASDARFIVTPRALEMFLGVVGSQLQWGPAIQVAAEKIKEELFWIRPTHLTGPDVRTGHEGACPACGEPLHCWYRRPGIYDRYVVDGFGDPQADIAAISSWIGDRTRPGGNAGILRDSLVSGGLFAYLYNCGLKGLGFPEAGVYSVRGEPAIESQRRFADLKTGTEDRILRTKIKATL